MPAFIILFSIIFLGTIFLVLAWLANDRGRAGWVAGWVVFEIYLAVLVSLIFAFITVLLWEVFFVTEEQRLQSTSENAIFATLYFAGAFGICFVIGLTLVLLHHSDRARDINDDD